MILEDCLHSRRLFRSVSLEETVRRCSRVFWPHRMDIVDRGKKHVDTIVDGIIRSELSLIYVKHGADVIIDADYSNNFYLIQYNLSGAGTVHCGKLSAKTGSGSTIVLSPSLRSVMTFNHETVQLGVKLNKQSVESCLEDLILAPINKPLVFDLKMKPDSTALQLWENVLQYLVSQYSLNFDDQDVPDWDNAIVKMVIDLLLRCHSHNYSNELVPYGKSICGPEYVRRGQEYIHDKCKEPISISDLSKVTGVTSRTLQNSFNKYLGCAPMEYVRLVKMQKIHKELTSESTDNHVTDIIVKYNIYNLGRFAQRYKKRYGCLPSETLRHHK